jgi:hypothetical protein
METPHPAYPDALSKTRWSFETGPAPISSPPYVNFKREVNFEPQYSKALNQLIEKYADNIGFDSGNMYSSGTTAVEQRQLRFGSQRQTSPEETYRAFLFIEPEDFYGVVERLLELGKIREQNGMRLEFVFDTPTQTFGTRELGFNQNLMRNIITLNGETLNELQVILHSLSVMDWSKIEQRRQSIAGNQLYRLKNTDSKRFNNLQTMEYNPFPGKTKT